MHVNKIKLNQNDITHFTEYVDIVTQTSLTKKGI